MWRAGVRAVIGLTGAVGCWWGLIVALRIPPFFLPTPADVADAFARHGPYLTTQAMSTLGHMLAGFAIAGCAATAVAGLLASWAPLRQAVLPSLVALQAVPKVALAPLLIVWFGFGPTAKIVLVALLCFFPILLATLTGLTSTPTELTEYAASLAAGRLPTFRAIRFWYALPHVFVGLKLGLTLSLIGAVVAEITTPNSGLGAVIVRAGQAADTPLAFAAITMLATIGTGSFYTLVAIERRLLPWTVHTTR